MASVYDNNQCICTIFYTSSENEDIEVKFMHPKGPSVPFKWPHRDVICWVANQHVLCKGWDGIFGYLTSHEAYCLCVGNHSDHYLHTRGWGDMTWRASPTGIRTQYHPVKGATTLPTELTRLAHSLWMSFHSDECYYRCNNYLFFKVSFCVFAWA